MEVFKLSKEFLDSYADKDPGFGFNGLGEITYRRTYSRVKEDGTKETWPETVQRVVEWVYQTQQAHINTYSLGWDSIKAAESAEEMFDRMFYMKFLPPGRGLWIAGTEVLKRGSVAAALNNCALCSTSNIDIEFSKPFRFMADMSMLGVGVGFTVDDIPELEIRHPQLSEDIVVIEDSREGWVDAIGTTIDGYLKGDYVPTYDFSIIRKKGMPIKGFGGTASGPEPLIELLENISKELSSCVGNNITEENVVNIMNHIGVCVIAGNVRRTAQIAIGKADSEEFIGLKNYQWNSELEQYVGERSDRASIGWASNNSVNAVLGMDYTKLGDRNSTNGEPGFLWMQNAREYSRMIDPPDNKDMKAAGANPCVEQTLEPYELCCLVETFPTRCDSNSDYLRTLKFAYLYAKTVTLCNTHWPETNRVMMRNRRIGTSMSGIAQFIDAIGIHQLKNVCESGYSELKEWDEIYSDWLCVPRSIKMTSIKPSGTVSLLAGVTPGIHFPENVYYIRRIRIPSNSDMVDSLKFAGYSVVADLSDTRSLVVEVPVKVEGVRPLKEVSMWEQLSIAAFMQKYWADNQVSATITFDPKTEGHQIKRALNYFQYQLKGVSFLPRVEGGAFHQMPYESISKDTYDTLSSRLKPIKFEDSGEAASGEKFCSNDTCTL